MAATAIYSVTMVLWKETAFPLCIAMERRWKRNVVSRVVYDYSDTGHFAQSIAKVKSVRPEGPVWLVKGKGSPYSITESVGFRS